MVVILEVFQRETMAISMNQNSEPLLESSGRAIRRPATSKKRKALIWPDYGDSQHVRIPPAAHNYQSDVETVHCLEEDEFFDLEDFFSHGTG